LAHRSAALIEQKPTLAPKNGRGKRRGKKQQRALHTLTNRGAFREREAKGMKKGEHLTKTERKAVETLRRALAGIPNSLVVYAVDDIVIACKKGVSVDEYMDRLWQGIMPGNNICDHDEFFPTPPAQEAR
jgi:hypothetical protein